MQSLYQAIHIFCLFFHFDYYHPSFFLWKPFIPGQTPVPHRSGTWIPDTKTVITPITAAILDFSESSFNILQPIIWLSEVID